MSKISKSERVGLWVERLNRLAGSSQTVAEFCLAEGISAPSLYQWKRKLSPRIDSPEEPYPASGGGSGSGLASGSGRQGVRSNCFAELMVGAVEPGAAVVLPGNIRIQLGREETVVAAIVGQVLEYACSSRRGDERC